MPTAPILVIGQSGQVARALVAKAAARGTALVAVGRPEIDLASPATISAAFARYSPATVINAAAYTAVDKAEVERDAARAINAEAVGIIAQLAAERGARLLHISTDYVYDGRKASPYVETDQVNPLSIYGKTKLDGECAAFDVDGANILIFRTAWVYNAGGSNFVRTMLRLAESKETIDVVDDQIGSPTLADDIADALLTVANTPAGTSGIYHLAGSGEATRADFAEEIFRQAEALGLPSAKVNPVKSEQFQTLAVRPLNSRLDTAKIFADFGIKLPDWRESLRRCLAEIALNSRLNR